MKEAETNISGACRSNVGKPLPKGKVAKEHLLRSSYDTVSDASQLSRATEISQDSIRSLPVLSASSGFAWAKSHNQDPVTLRLHRRKPLLAHTSSAIDTTSITRASNNSEVSNQVHTASRGRDELPKRAVPKQHNSHLNRQSSFDPSDLDPSQDSSSVVC